MLVQRSFQWENVDFYTDEQLDRQIKSCSERRERLVSMVLQGRVDRSAVTGLTEELDALQTEYRKRHG